MTVTLPWPPSVNGYWRSFEGRQILSKRGRDYRAEVALTIIACGLKSFSRNDRLKVILACRPPDKRKRDLDNIPKALLDAVQRAGIIPDDEQIDIMHVHRWPPHKPGCVHVSIDVIGQREYAADTDAAMQRFLEVVP